jgi:eukaryotic-like serine/threonine-protein kinase
MDPARWQRVATIFDEIADAPPSARESLLHELCGTDDELRAEVATMLAADAVGGVFEQGVDSARDATALEWADDDEEQSTRRGERIGPWRLTHELGQGGMGVVWLAERADGQFQQCSALKVIKRGMDSNSVVARFMRERQILARLEHTNIARLLDGGVAADGSPYFAMEYVDGHPLLGYCQERDASLEQRITLFLAICSAVQFAHGHLIVHRDIKPSNVLVTAAGEPKLLDFGIAKILSAEAGDAALSTVLDGHRPMTLAYAAPEQLRGEPVTVATDIYALGSLLYELLTGHRAFEFGEAATPDQVRHTVETTDPTSPSKVISLDTLIAANELRGDLDTIVLMTLHRDPQRRYPTVEALASDLRRFLAGQPITARRDSVSYRIGKFISRHRIGVTATAAAVALLLFVTALSVYMAYVAHRQTEEARAQARRAETTREFLVDVFGQVSPDQNQGQPITAHQLLDTAEREVNTEFDEQAASKVELSAMLGELYRDIGDRPKGQALIEKSLKLIDDRSVPQEVRARALLSIATNESEDKETFQTALDHARTSAALLERQPEADPETLARAHMLIGYALRHLNKNDEAVQVLADSVIADSHRLGSRNKAIAEEWVQLGIAQEGLQQYEQSDASFHEGLAIYRAVYGENSQHVAHALDALAGMQHAKGDYVSAESNYRQALAIDAAKLGANHHDSMVDRANLLGILELQGKFSEALAERLALIERDKASGQLNKTDLAYDYLAAGIDYIEVSRFDDGERTLRDAVELIAASKGKQSAFYAYALEFLGYALPWQDKYEEAEQTFRTALGLVANDKASRCRLQDSLSWVLDLEHRFSAALTLSEEVDRDCTRSVSETALQRPTFLADLSTIQLDNGQPAEAQITGENALNAARKIYPPKSYRLGVPLFALARADLALERNADAEVLLREALAVREPPYASNDPRVLEVDVELIKAMMANGKVDEANTIKLKMRPLLVAQTSRYAADLRDRLER